MQIKIQLPEIIWKDANPEPRPCFVSYQVGYGSGSWIRSYAFGVNLKGMSHETDLAFDDRHGQF
jgi:hypothetical protein